MKRKRVYRSILNYGHTIGHALERVEGYGRLRHGEAVALGMMGEAILGEKLGITPSKVVEKQREILIGLHLPTQLRDNIEREEFLLLSVKIKRKREENRDWFFRRFWSTYLGSGSGRGKNWRGTILLGEVKTN